MLKACVNASLIKLQPERQLHFNSLSSSFAIVFRVSLNESKELLQLQRTAGNLRLFNRGILKRIAIIRIAQTSGISLSDIKTALEQIPHDRKASAKEWGAVSTGWATSLKRRIDQLQKLSTNLEGCLDMTA